MLVNNSMMGGTVVHAQEAVTLVGGAPFGPDDLTEALRLAPRLVAADSGADRALALGLQPEAVIGDMDSLSAGARAVLGPRMHVVPEQETTDFDKALSRIAAPLVLAVGFEGGRLDHALAALHGLVRRAERPCILVGPQTVTCHLPPRLDLGLGGGVLVSLFPLRPVRVDSVGLRWSTTDLVLDPLGRIGTSNESVGPVVLQPDGPGLLLILPRAELSRLAEALTAAPRWPPARDG